MVSKLGFAVLALALVVAGGAQADDESGDDDFTRRGFYLGAGFTWAFHSFPGLDEDLATTVRSGNSPGFQVLGGYRFFSWLGAEFEYEYIDGFENKVAGETAFRLRHHMVTANAKLILPIIQRFQP
jgi:opacity protein-like surface antigen